MEDCTSCTQRYNYYYLFYESLNKLKKISEELDKEKNEDREAEIIHKLGDELNKLDVKINIVLCYGCQKKNIFDPLYELLTKLNESNESIISNKSLDTLKIIEDCTSCTQRYNYYYLFYESLNELKKISEELDGEENEDRKAEIIHRSSDELNELDVKINRLRLCYGCQKKNILNPLYELLTKLNESNESIISNKILDTLKIIEDCTSCTQRYNYYYLFYESLNKLKKISEELDKEKNEDREAEIIHKLSDELNKLDVKISIILCYRCQKKNIFDPLYELLTKLNESNESIISNKSLDTLKIIEDCTSCIQRYNYYYLFYESLNELKKITEELDGEENEDRRAEIIHKSSDELNKLDVEINIVLCDECQKKNIFDPLYELLTKLNESNASINSNKLLDTLKIIEDCTKLDKEENENRKAEIIHKSSDELNELDVKINRLRLCDGCQKKNILNPLYELLTKLNESNESIISNKLLDTLKIIEDCTSCAQRYNYYYLFYESLNELKKISEALDKEKNEDRKAEIIHKLGDELNKLDVEINRITLCYGCQKKNIFDPLYELLTKLNESNESINSNKSLDTLKIIECCTKNCISCKEYRQKNYFVCKSLNEIKKISEELDKEENEDGKTEIIHKLGNELSELDAQINIVLCYGCRKKNIFNSLYELLTKLNESNEQINLNKLLDTLKKIEDCTSCAQRRYNYNLFYKSLNELRKISEELDKEENEDRKAEIIHKLSDELNKLDVKINISLCDGCQKKNTFNPLYELLTKLNESNASINSNKLLDTLKIIKDCTKDCISCTQIYNYYYLFYESLNELKKISEELDKEENENRKAEIIHKLSDELNELDVKINITLCYGCQKKNILNPLYELLTKLNESNESIISNKLLDTLKIIKDCTKDCTSCTQRYNYYYLFYESLNELKKISEELDGEENEDRKAEIIHKSSDELNKLDVEINIVLCDECQKKNIFDPLYELLTKLNESNASINSNKLLDTLKIIEDCTSCAHRRYNYYLLYESLNKLKKISEELDKEENENRKAEIIHKSSDELNELDVKINRLRLCDGCQKKNILNPLYELLTKLNESNESIISNKLLDTLKIIEDCTSCAQRYNYYYLFYESLNELKKISEALDKEKNEDRKAEIIHKLGDELNKLDVEINRITLCYGCQKKNIFDPLYELLTKLNESNESINSNKSLDTLKIIECCTKNCISCKEYRQKNYFVCKSLNEIKKISEELDKEENEDGKTEIIHKLGNELSELDAQINIVLCYGCRKKNIFNSLYELLTKLNESNEQINLNKLLDTLKKIEDCTSCAQRRYNYNLFYKSLNELRKISEELDKEENEDRKAEIIHKLSDELNKLDVKINISLCDGCQKKNTFNPLYELLTKLNESNASINSNKLLDTLKIIKDCTKDCISCTQIYNYYYLFYESLNELKKISEELDKEENENRKAEIIHKLSDELNELDVKINITLCYG
ncbi:2701_t:CDS:2, partial [Entrophospora sp. SA101]